MRVKSENQRLRRVIVHRPGISLELLQPCNVKEGSSKYLLMDDLLFVKRAREEHAIFCAVLKTAAEVFDVNDLLEGLLEGSKSRPVIVKAMSVPHQATALPSKQLVEVILSGRYRDKAYAIPSPNLIFTRDVAAFMGKAIILSSAATFPGLTVSRPREREMQLMSLIFKMHPLFRDYEIVEIAKNRSQPFSREGGDFFALSEEIAAIGISQRTERGAIKEIAPAIFRQGFHSILLVHLPLKRRYMHLDTVFSMLHPDECVVFEEVIKHKDTFISQIEKRDPEKEVRLKGSFVSVLEEQLKRKLTVHPCGGGDHIVAAREQWTDGTNLLALAPGLAISYDRNEGTARYLERQGYQLLTPTDYLANPGPYLQYNVKAIILIPSAELSRGRGGPRCLSLPIARG